MESIKMDLSRYYLHDGHETLKIAEARY